MYTDYGYYDEDTILGLIILLWLALSVFIGIYKITLRWLIYRKAGKGGWEAIIPFYNKWTYYEVSGYPGYFMFFTMIPYIGFIIALVFRILAGLSLAKKFKKSDAFGVFLIAFFPIIGLSILAFGKSKYHPYEGEQSNISVNTGEKANDDNMQTDVYEKAIEINNKNEEYKFCGYCGTKVLKTEKICKKCKKELI